MAQAAHSRGSDADAMTDKHRPTDSPADQAADEPQGDPHVPAPAPGRPAGRLSPLAAGATARVWSLRTVAATAVTAVALSGVGGAALAAASDGGSGQGGRPGAGFGAGATGQQPPGRAHPFGLGPEDLTRARWGVAGRLRPG